MTTVRRKRARPLSNTTTMWRVYVFVVNELEKEARTKGFQSVPNLVNFLFAAYFSDEVVQRSSVDINDIDLSWMGSKDRSEAARSSLGTIQTSWRILSRSFNSLRQDAKALDTTMSGLANNILLRYVLGQRVQRGQ